MKKKLKKIKFLYYLNDVSNLISANLRLENKKLIFTQVPRCSTSIITSLIKKNLKDQSNIEFPTHYFKPKFNKNCNYFISIRDPIERFASAYFHLKNGQFITYYDDFFSIYPTIEKLAKEIFSKKARNYIRLSHHLNEDLNSFITIEFLKKNLPAYLITHDSLLKDTEDFLKLRLNLNSFDKTDFKKEIITTKKDDISLSKNALINLKEFLKKDYEIYNYLIKEKKKINSKKY